MAQTQDGDAHPTETPTPEPDILQLVLTLLTEPPPAEQDAAILIDQNARLRSALTQMTSGLREKTTKCLTLERKAEALTIQVASLKDVVSLTREMLAIRNTELKHLQTDMDTMQGKIKEMKASRVEMINKLDKAYSLNDQLKSEYSTQLEIFENLKEKYKQRANLMETIADQKNNQPNASA